ncbi:hypothetical protein [Enterococcus ratti]|uniref:Uncharacterized protein n=1 Tax=Enterococcus ratti TaxID=150033 RepID=A0A1L8WLG5_9ENTE|nr:hypothetical protein [Enterococcus ratti]OJG81856.1 hypothetical protein RV14_GL002399 [Enterococcus ratti]
MKTTNYTIGITHILSIVICSYLDLYSIQQPIVANSIIFSISLTDSLILSILLFSIIFIGNIFGSIASFLNFSISPLLSLSLGLVGICGLLLFSKAINAFWIFFGVISLFQIIISTWELFRSLILMKINE